MLWYVVISIVKIIFNLLINNIMNKLKEKALKLGAEDLKKSTRKNKRLMVKYNNKWIHFGDPRNIAFVDHKDKKRRKNYMNRARGIKNKKGQRTYKIKTSPNFWSYTVLWDG